MERVFGKIANIFKGKNQLDLMCGAFSLFFFLMVITNFFNGIEFMQ